MTQDLPFVSCLCCTYRRSTLLANAVSCFLAQDYPPERREMLILDDYGEYRNHEYGGYRVVSFGNKKLENRIRSLSEKHNVVASMARGNVLVVWDDDDVYLPWHISSHVKALHQGEFSKPSKVYSLYNRAANGIYEEDARGRFHGSLAFVRRAYRVANGWPLTEEANFDQQMINRMGMFHEIDTCRFAAPSYVYRWETTGCAHPSGYMTEENGDRWYDQYAKLAKFQPSPEDGLVYPRFDEETKWVYSRVDREKGLISAP